MATQTLSSSHILDDDAPQATARSRKPSLMRRFYLALLIGQQRRAQRHIDRVLDGRTPAQAFRAPPRQR